MTTIVALLAAIVLIGCSLGQDTVASAPEGEPLVVFLLRHGGKADLRVDPTAPSRGR